MTSSDAYLLGTANNSIFGVKLVGKYADNYDNGANFLLYDLTSCISEFDGKGIKILTVTRLYGFSLARCQWQYWVIVEDKVQSWISKHFLSSQDVVQPIIIVPCHRKLNKCILGMNRSFWLMSRSVHTGSWKRNNRIVYPNDHDQQIMVPEKNVKIVGKEGDHWYINVLEIICFSNLFLKSRESLAGHEIIPRPWDNIATSFEGGNVQISWYVFELQKVATEIRMVELRMVVEVMNWENWVVNASTDGIEFNFMHFLLDTKMLPALKQRVQDQHLLNALKNPAFNGKLKWLLRNCRKKMMRILVQAVQPFEGGDQCNHSLSCGLKKNGLSKNAWRWSEKMSSGGDQDYKSSTFELRESDISYEDLGKKPRNPAVPHCYSLESTSKIVLVWINQFKNSYETNAASITEDETNDATALKESCIGLSTWISLQEKLVKGTVNFESLRRSTEQLQINPFFKGWMEMECFEAELHLAESNPLKFEPKKPTEVVGYHYCRSWDKRVTTFKGGTLLKQENVARFDHFATVKLEDKLEVKEEELS